MVVVALVARVDRRRPVLRPLHTITATAREISATNLHRRLGPTGRTPSSASSPDPRRPVRPAGAVVRVAAALRGQRLARAAHPAHRRASGAAGRARRSGGHRRHVCARPAGGAGPRRGAGAPDRRRCSRWPAATAASNGGSRSTSARSWRAVVRQRRAEAERRGVEVRRARPAPADGDPSLVESLVANLVDNACGTTWPADGSRCRRRRSTAAPRTVRNTGPVVPPDEIDRLFQPFQRLGRRAPAMPTATDWAWPSSGRSPTAHGATVPGPARPEGGLQIEVDF